MIYPKDDDTATSTTHVVGRIERRECVDLRYTMNVADVPRSRRQVYLQLQTPSSWQEPPSRRPCVIRHCIEQAVSWKLIPFISKEKRSQIYLRSRIDLKSTDAESDIDSSMGSEAKSDSWSYARRLHKTKKETWFDLRNEINFQLTSKLSKLGSPQAELKIISSRTSYHEYHPEWNCVMKDKLTEYTYSVRKSDCRNQQAALWPRHTSTNRREWR